MWLTDGGAREVWSCEQCAADADLHCRRGRCHGRLDATLEGADLDDRGLVVITGDAVVSGARPPFGESTWSTCPIAAARQPATRELLAIHRASRDGRLFDSPDLTMAALDALDHAATEEAALRAWQTKRARIEAGA